VVRVLLIVLFPLVTHAWGGRGHDALCEAASFLVKDKNLAEFMQYRSHIMGHLCNVPDVYWKSLSAEVRKAGDSTHFIDPEVIGLKISDIPLDYSEIVKKYSGSDNKYKANAKIFSIPEEFGSVWWRADQFARKIAGLDFKDAAPPERKQEQDDKLPYNSKIYDMMVYMGLMGHFVGDASQPFHNTADYDGYGQGHGGIHSYYETEVVSHFGSELAGEVQKKAKSMGSAPFLKGKNALEKMKALSLVSIKDIPKIMKLDPVTKKSGVLKERGMEIKSSADRKPSAAGYKVLRPLIVEEMARGALLLAHLWDEAYVAAGKPDLSKYRSYKYPHTPEFVPPDYGP
jgi:hypothetical protein